jgi:membrane-bound lytic murein transglycosylase F
MSKKSLILSIILLVSASFWGSDGFGERLAYDIADKEISAAIAKDTAVDAMNAALPYTISEFDGVMRRIGKEEGQDWLLLSAIAYSESRFQEDLVSRRGAIGLMQIMPIVGKQFDVAKEDIADTETNIRLAGKLLSKIESTLKLAPSTSKSDRLSIILACYNGGIGHVSDARRLARSNGEDYNSWSVVARYLQQKANPEVYESEVVRYGKFTGSKQTEAYVREVMKRYEMYRRIAQGA